MSGKAGPEWLDKTGFGVIGSFSLRDGEQVRAEIVDYDEETNELIVQQILKASRVHVGDGSPLRVPVDGVLSFEPESDSQQHWPQSDPCRNAEFSASRFVSITGLFLLSTAGSLFLFIAFMNGGPYRLQELSAISYTCSVTFVIFAGLRGADPFMFSCPAVKANFPKLMWRHVGFLIALFSLQTVALAVRPGLAAWWSTRDSKGGTPFEMTLMFSCLALGFIEVYTSRSVLKRAHLETTPDSAPSKPRQS